MKTVLIAAGLIVLGLAVGALVAGWLGIEAAAKIINGLLGKGKGR